MTRLSALPLEALDEMETTLCELANAYASLREETLCANSFLRTDFDVAILKDIEYEIRSEVRSVSRERAKRWEAIERTDNLDYRNSVYP